MIVAVPKEIKDKEARVALTPIGALELVKQGVEVLIESNAGSAIGFSDEDYIASGAKIAKDIKEIYAKGDLIFKVKEPQKIECDLMRKGQVLFSYLHLAAEPEMTKSLLEKQILAIAFETVEDDMKALPLLRPMSEVAGRVATQFAAFALQKNNGGPGLLIGGATGVKPLNVTVVGGGVVGYNAALMAAGLGGNVRILEKSAARIAELNQLFAGKVEVIQSSADNLRNLLKDTNLLVGAILLPGAKAPKIITAADIACMPKNAVFVDVAIDQGGCSETSRPTTHSNPTYIAEGVIHYCVTNMPAAASSTASKALENATLPYLLNLVKNGVRETLLKDSNFRAGLNIAAGKITNKHVAEALGYEYFPPNQVI